jgi:hypothetical protein
MMNPVIATQIQAFRDEVVHPTFLDLKAELENSQTIITLIENTANASESVEAVVRQMHPETPYLGSEPSASALAPSSIVESLYVEIVQTLDLDKVCCIGQYCLSIEISLLAPSQLQVMSIMGYVYPQALGQRVEVQRGGFENNGQGLDLEVAKSFDIAMRCLESFGVFETQLKASEQSLPSAPEASLSAIALDFSPSTTAASESVKQTSPEAAAEAAAEPTPFTEPQVLYDLSKQLTQALSPNGFPITSTLNLKLLTPAEIKPIQDRYGRAVDLGLEYSSTLTECELTEYLHRLGHYQTLRHLAHLHIFVQEQMQAWHKQNGQPSVGAIAPFLKDEILKLRDRLYERIQTLTDSRLETAASVLEMEVNELSARQQRQQTLLERIEQNPLLGYLDVGLLETNPCLDRPIEPFTHPGVSSDFSSQHHSTKNGGLILSHITSCEGEKYKAYCLGRPEHPWFKLMIEYTITQKLYPQRPVFRGAAARPVYPSLELLWGDDAMTLDGLTQIWCIYPMMRTDPPQWLVIAATSDTQGLRTMALADGRVAQEGTYAYLNCVLEGMAQGEDEYVQGLSGRVSEALGRRCVKYLHVHQTQDGLTGRARDILSMQFRLFG